MDKNILVIGVGNKYRSDDGAGLHIVQKIKDKDVQNVIVKETSGEGASLMDLWEDESKVIIVDAVSSGGKVGKIYRFEAHIEEIPSKFFHYSTHAFSLAEAIELARALGKLPKSLIVFGIEGENYNAGSELSPKLKGAIGEVVWLIEQEIEKLKKENQYA